MNIEIILSFTANILLLLGLAVVYSLFPQKTKIGNTGRGILMGLLIAVIGITIMSTPYEISPGIIFDARAVAISITAMFIGIIPTVIAGAFMIAYRLYIGGSGAAVGVAWIVLAAVIGLLWRNFRLKNSRFEKYKITWVELYLVSLLVHIVMISLLLFLPVENRSYVIKEVSFILITIYPLGGLIISQFMLTQRLRYFKIYKTIESETQYRGLFQMSKTMMFLINSETGQIIDANYATLKKYGYTLEEIKYLHIKDINTLSDEESQEMLEKAGREERNYFELQHVLKNRDIINVEVHSGPVELNGEHFILTSVYDVTELMKNEKKYRDVDEKFKATLLSVGEGIIVTDKSSRITLINEKAKDILNEKIDPTGRKIFDVIKIQSASQNYSFKDIFKNCLENIVSFKSDDTFKLIREDQSENSSIDFNISPINFEKDENHGAILVIRDVTLERADKDQIRFISHHDFLTSLYNRLFFEEQLARLNTSRQLPLTIIIGDVNGLKLLNDTFGHLEGDNLLIEVGKIMRKATRSEDIVARWGGDEFAILLPQTSFDDAMSVYKRIKDLCEKSMFKPISPSISLGCATKTNATEDIFEILKTAEELMYREKLKEGSNMRNSLISSLLSTLLVKNNESIKNTNIKIELSSKFAKKLELDQDNSNRLALLARLHDIGKISIKNDILRKPEKLNEEEKDKVSQHPEVGSRIVKSIPELQHLSEDILHHHEHYDGTGYPSNLIGKNIPLLARVISIIDAYEIMINGRVYREAISHKETILELQKKSGKQFDPDLLAKFISIF
jgi:diguanylate cyclase (GGDEF)-like protein/PAS domain S-box-containing protein